MRKRVGSGAKQSLFLPGEKNKSDRTLRPQTRSFDSAQRINYECRVASVVQRAGAEFPRGQMSAENNKLVGLLRTFDFRNDVGGLYRAANLIGNRKIRPQRMA